MENSQKVVIGIEIGGTNVKVAIAPVYEDVNQIKDMITSGKIQIKELKTRKNPLETVKEITSLIFKENEINSDQIEKVYISNFGPIELNKKSNDYGLILNTPKLGWKHFNVIKTFVEYLKISPEKVKVDLDVSCAAFLEHKLGNHKYNNII
jgi:fructokinase